MVMSGERAWCQQAPGRRRDETPAWTHKEERHDEHEEPDVVCAAVGERVFLEEA